jgi:hypothetical protein
MELAQDRVERMCADLKVLNSVDVMYNEQTVGTNQSGGLTYRTLFQMDRLMLTCGAEVVLHRQQKDFVQVPLLYFHKFLYIYICGT